MSYGSNALSRVLVQNLDALVPCVCDPQLAIVKSDAMRFSSSPDPLPSLPSVRTWTIPQPMPLAHFSSEVEPSAIFLEVIH